MELCHFERQFLATEDMEVQVGHGLAGVGAAVADHTVAVYKALFFCDHGDHLKNMGNHTAVFGRNAGNRRNVGLGDHQNVGGSLGVNVPEGQNQFVLIDLGRGDLTSDDLTNKLPDKLKFEILTSAEKFLFS